MRVQHFFHEQTSTLSYVVHDATTALVIDPVRDYDAASARTSWKSCETIATYLRTHNLTVPYVIDTHVHADHITGLPYFKEHFSSATVTGARTGEVQARFRDVYNLGTDFRVDGSQFDVLIDEGEQLEVGSMVVEAIYTPGHTSAHMSWKIDDAVFVGDTLFMPDYGSARCDFPGGSAEDLFDSVQRIYEMPDATRLFMCHDYRPGGRELEFETTVAAQKRNNIQINEGTSKEEYVAFRKEKDATLPAPKLILPSLQVNIRAGSLPAPEENGLVYLRTPLNYL
ncbi:MAG: MBL fold metallo-hydrolase [Pseudomonadales bacterium]